jgi:hypothetical protein
MPHRRDRNEQERGEFSAGPFGRRGFEYDRPRRIDRDDFGGDFGGDYARDTHRGGLGDEYARDAGWSGGGAGDQYTRENFWGGTGAAGDWHGGAGRSRGSSYLGFGPARTRSTFGSNDTGGSAVPYGEIDPAGRSSFRGRGPKNWRRSDESIREDVNEFLTDDHEVDASDIEVAVENGEVTLTGAVQSRRERRLAEDIAASCRGVHDVHNRLSVSDAGMRLGKASE